MAVTFGIDVNALGINQVRNRLFNAVTEGDKANNRWVNSSVFMELVQSDDKRKVAKIVYDAIKNKDIIFSTKDWAWHYINQSETGERVGEVILQLSGVTAGKSIQLLITECINNVKKRLDLYRYLGINLNPLLEEYRAMTIVQLREKCKEKEIYHTTATEYSKERLVELLCEREGVLYEKPS